MIGWRAIGVLAVLAVAAAGLAGWAWIQARAPLAVAGQGEMLLPDLARQVEQVARIELRQGSRLFVLRRLDDGRWVAGDADWPVPAAQVRSVLVTLMEMKKAQPATALPERYRAIFVDDPTPESLAARLVLKDRGGKVLADVILGKEAEDWLGGGRTGQFVRLTGNKRAWLVEGHVRPSTRLTAWADTSLLKLAEDDLAEVVIRRDGEEVRLLGKAAADAATSGEDDVWAELPLRLADAPPGAKPRASMLRQLHLALSDLRFEEVRKADTLTGGKQVTQVKVRTGDGLEVALEVFHRKGAGGDAGWWLRGRVAQPGKNANLAEKLRQQLQGRAFRMYDSAGAALVARLSDLIEAQALDLGGGVPAAAQAPDGSGSGSSNVFPGNGE